MSTSQRTENERETRDRGHSPSDDLDQRTLAAAVDLVLEDALEVLGESLGIEQALVQANLPEQADRLRWEQYGTRSAPVNLCRAAIIYIVKNLPAGNAERTGNYALTEIAASIDQLDSHDVLELRAVRSELIRDAAAFNFGLLQTKRWRVYKALTSIIASREDEELRAAVAYGEESLLTAYGRLFELLAEMFKLQLRPGCEMVHFTMSVFALNDGLSNRIGTPFSRQILVRDEREWTVFAVGFEALVDSYFVPETGARGDVR